MQDASYETLIEKKNRACTVSVIVIYVDTSTPWLTRFRVMQFSLTNFIASHFMPRVVAKGHLTIFRKMALLTIIKTLKQFKLQCLVPLATTTTLPHQKRTMQTYEHTSIYRHSSYSSTLHTHTHLKHITKSFRKHGKRRKLDSYHELWLPFALPTAKSKKIH